MSFSENWSACRWSINPSEAFLFVRHSANKLNLLDVEKKAYTLANSVQLDSRIATLTVHAYVLFFYDCFSNVLPNNSHSYDILD